MKWIIPILLLFPQLLKAQSSLIFDVPNTPGLLANLKIKGIKIYEWEEGIKKLTNEYSINESGEATVHFYYDPYSADSLPVIEKSEVFNGDQKYVKYTRGRYDLKGNLIKVYETFYHYYSPTNKLTSSQQFFTIDLIKHIYQRYDTTDYEKINKVEIILTPDNDTIRRVSDFYNGFQKVHVFESKTDSGWLETEKNISLFSGGKLQKFYSYKNGKLISTYDANEHDPSRKLGDDTYKIEQEFGLPLPVSQNDTFYVNQINTDKIISIKPKVAKLKLIMYYEQGKGYGLSYYKVFDNKTGLILLTSGPHGEFRTEYEYIFR